MRTTIGRLPWPWAILCLIGGLAIGWWHPGETSAVTAALEGRLLDLRHVLRGPVAPPEEFAIVAIDDRTLGRLQRFPVPRAVIADSVNRLTDAGAKVLAIDLLLAERESPGGGDSLSPGDLALAAALARHGHTILAATQAADIMPDADLVRRNLFGQVMQSDFPPPGRVGFLFPIEALARAADLGHVNLVRDADGAVRRIALAMPIAEADYLPAMALDVVRLMRDLPRSALRLVVGESIGIDDQTIPIAPDNTVALNHYGGQGAFPTYSLIDVIDGKIPADRIAGRAIFIGSTALASGDMFTSPFGPQLPGVEALATAAANVAHGQFLRRDLGTLAIDFAVAGLLGVLAFFAANPRSLTIAAVISVGLWILTFIGAQLAFSRAFLWLDVTTYILVLATIGIATLAARIVQQRRISDELQHERDNLARYHSPLLTEFLAEQQRPSFNERAQHAAVMFVDVAAFTRRAERLGPAATVEFLRDLHGRIERAALANRGVIEQFMGDGAMIIFGLPEPKTDDAARALASTQQLLESLADWNLDLEAEAQEPVRLRIGLHYGPVIAALLGGERQGQVTVAGDTVNVASRLQEMGKENKAAIIASAEFVAGVRQSGRDDMLTGMRRLTGQKVRGRDETIDIWVWP
ncbi:MAG: CHASE2 domain-containing protein [Dongiaceae bacterium]